MHASGARSDRGGAGRYVEIAPHPALRASVECYWIAAGDGIEREVLPDGCVDFLFDAAPRGLGARLVGAMTRPLPVPAARRDLVAVRFRPGGAFPFAGAPLDAFTDGGCELRALGARHAELGERGTANAPARERLRAVEDWLLAHLPARRDAVDGALAALANGATRVDAAAAAAGVSRQHFARTVRARSGLPPKLLARICRLRRALADARAGGGALAAVQLALAHGYADQAHLARDVRALTGGTLTALRG